MNISSNKKRYIRLLIVLLLVAITAGAIFMFRLLGKSQEEHRNREYEVSLVNALKNSYQGIKEIKIMDPYYNDKPGSWSCDISVEFNDSQTITYGINHRLTYKENHDGLMKGKTNEEIDQQWSILQKHIGKTESTILVRYSNGETGKQ
ncbi:MULTISPECIES: hypothetical protein [Streptococcus]|jgi:hypothetical protein|uniref:DUF1433 domain-containing protein n=2 Tax=Streptococcus oralis TaxID=1303 RepID=A0A1X1IAC2_STROR|nr:MULTISPECIES: hypothetical protein [Streptococcus]MBA1351242.1 hypothetical protein [Streptococcus oralis subsp. oralis]MBK3299271.1 hypothetical protein [Streptococcus oralis]MBR8666165.1 hypothetical protein [Streptococcus oralis]MBS9396365.1 hypothetical protein [Streptococcus oralis]MBT3114955.1 hypothetical protein [Streptococcus oralis]